MMQVKVGDICGHTRLKGIFCVIECEPSGGVVYLNEANGTKAPFLENKCFLRPLTDEEKLEWL
jgi:hypothetical protein